MFPAQSGSFHTMPAMTSIWNEYTISSNEPRLWQVGAFQLWLAGPHRELRLATGVDEDADDDLLLIDKPGNLNAQNQRKGKRALRADELVWKRYASEHAAQQQVRLSPLMPDKPLVVRPEMDLIIPRRSKAVVYAMLPIWIKVELVLKGDDFLTLCEAPSVILSKSWFGEDTLKGTLCYAMRTTARLNKDDLPERTGRAICTIVIENRADENIQCRRLCLPVANMSLYWQNDRLYSSGIHVIQTAGDDEELDIVEKNQDGKAFSNLLTAPRQANRNRLHRAIDSWLPSIIFRA